MKHNFSCWCPNIRGGGGGSSQLGQNPKFGRKFYLTAPLVTCKDVQWTGKSIHDQDLDDHSLWTKSRLRSQVKR